MVVAYPPGGTADILASGIATGLTQQFGQTLVVEIKPSANGNIAAELDAKSPADRLTLLMTAPGPVAVNVSLYSSLPFDLRTAFAPVSLAGIAPLLLLVLVPQDIPVLTLRELLDDVKANPARATSHRRATRRPRTSRLNC